MKLTVMRRNGEVEVLDIAMPVTFSGFDNEKLMMWRMQDAQGTDYFFNKSDGTYDGWGRAVSSNAEAEAVLQQARAGTPPKIKVQ